MKKQLLKFLSASALVMGLPMLAHAEEVAHATSSSDVGFALALAAGLGIGIAAFGGALGQGKAAAAALEGIARNPEAAGKVMTPMIIALALIESLVLYALLIALMLTLKL